MDDPHTQDEHGARGFAVAMLVIVFILGVLCGALADRFFCGGC